MNNYNSWGFDEYNSTIKVWKFTGIKYKKTKKLNNFLKIR